jgi:hypothetical protein
MLVVLLAKTLACCSCTPHYRRHALKVSLGVVISNALAVLGLPEMHRRCKAVTSDSGVTD